MVKVLNSGFYSTIQDLGRFGFFDYGVPYSGVMDSYASKIANALLGNDENCAVLEIIHPSIKLKFEVNTLICLVGANMIPKLNSKEVANTKAIRVKAGDVLSFDKLILGCRCYLAVSHGFKTEVVMNSRSMFKCVTEQFKLKKGDVLQINGMPNAFTKKKYAKLKFNDLYLKTREIEAYAGAEFHLLSKYQQEKLITTLFSVSKDSNRMAYQLLEPLENSLQAIITSPVIPGTVQLTPSGRLIILMRDCQTTGGYPRVLQLKEQSINTLAQKPINARIKFSLVIPITG